MIPRDGKYIVKGKVGTVVFKRVPERLYVMELDEMTPGVNLITSEDDTPSAGVNMIETVEENMQGFSKRQIERAKVARNLYETIGFPSINDYKKIVKMNGIRNCPVTIDDINNMEKIFGTNIYTLKGKVTGQTHGGVKDYIDVPKELKMKNENVELCADIMYVQKQKFLVTISKHIKFVTTTPVAEAKMRWHCAKHLMKYFGFIIRQVFGLTHCMLIRSLNF